MASTDHPTYDLPALDAAALKGVSVKLENAYRDGDYSALINVYGEEFSVAAKDGQPVVRKTGSAAYDRRARWQKRGGVELARRFVSARIAQLPSEWLDLNCGRGPIAQVAA